MSEKETVYFRENDDGSYDLVIEDKDLITQVDAAVEMTGLSRDQVIENAIRSYLSDTPEVDYTG